MQDNHFMNQKNKEQLHLLALKVREQTNIGVLDAKRLLLNHDMDIDTVVNLIRSTPLNKLFPFRLN